MQRNTVRFWGGRLLLVTAFCFVLFTLTANSSFAQIDTGSVLGTVTDSSGGRVSGATVTLTNEGTNAAVSTTTGANGSYSVGGLTAGTTYKVTVTAPAGYGVCGSNYTNVNVNCTGGTANFNNVCPLLTMSR